MATLNRVQRGESYAGWTDLTIMCCPVCGVTYAIPEALRGAAEKKGHHAIEWSCPNGHELGYSGQSEAEKLREQLSRARDATAYERSRREQAEASASAQKGRATRFKNERDRIKTRVENGVCPHCNRTFKDLQRHMKSKHPGCEHESVS